MIRATINTAPKVLNTADKAMWVTGWNDCVDAHPEPTGAAAPKYQFDERGHCRSDDGQPELSEEEICRRLSEWQCMMTKINDYQRQLLAVNVASNERLSAYKKRMQPRFDDADRFVALATAFVTQDPRFAALCDNAPLHPATVDEVRHAVDCARAPCSNCPYCGCDTSGYIQNHAPDCENFPL